MSVPKVQSVLVTGANGFVGFALLERLAAAGHELIGISRKSVKFSHPNFRNVQVSSLDSNIDLTYALMGVDVVVHLAARVHVMNDKSADALAKIDNPISMPQ